MISVVIPAHDESARIGACLSALLTDAEPNELDVIVVCNGCTDDTAAVATRFEPAVRVLEIPEASKPGALNLGDEHSDHFPRFYLDADVQLGHQAVRRIARILEEGEALAAAPGVSVDTRGCPWSVCAYERVWSSLPQVRDSVAGRGVFALSKAGRARFSVFPDLIADDQFVNGLFSPEERRVVDGCASVVRAPRSLTALVGQKTRVFTGNQQLERQDPRRRNPAGRRWAGLAALVRSQPALAPHATVYAGVNAVAKTRARWRYSRGTERSWDRDATARALG